MSKDDLFFEGDPLDHPTWKEAAKAEKKVKHQTSDFVGCPIFWLERALPYLGENIKSSLRCCYIAAGYCAAGAGRSISLTAT